MCGLAIYKPWHGERAEGREQRDKCVVSQESYHGKLYRAEQMLSDCK